MRAACVGMIVGVVRDKRPVEQPIKSLRHCKNVFRPSGSHPIEVRQPNLLFQGCARLGVNLRLPTSSAVVRQSWWLALTVAS